MANKHPVQAFLHLLPFAPLIFACSRYQPYLQKAEVSFTALEQIYYYMIGMSFVRVEESHFIQALKLLRPDVTLPLHERISKGWYMAKARLVLLPY